jgi:hypothetical protein
MELTTYRVDLHLKTREQSLVVVNRRLNLAACEVTRNHRCIVLFDTGVGRHSDGPAVLRPWLRDILTHRGYDFQENHGRFAVIVWNSEYRRRMSSSSSSSHSHSHSHSHRHRHSSRAAARQSSRSPPPPESAAVMPVVIPLAHGRQYRARPPGSYASAMDSSLPDHAQRNVGASSPGEDFPALPPGAAPPPIAEQGGDYFVDSEGGVVGGIRIRPSRQKSHAKRRQRELAEEEFDNTQLALALSLSNSTDPGPMASAGMWMVGGDDGEWMRWVATSSGEGDMNLLPSGLLESDDEYDEYDNDDDRGGTGGVIDEDGWEVPIDKDLTDHLPSEGGGDRKSENGDSADDDIAKVAAAVRAEEAAELARVLAEIAAAEEREVREQVAAIDAAAGPAVPLDQQPPEPLPPPPQQQQEQQQQQQQQPPPAQASATVAAISSGEPEEQPRGGDAVSEIVASTDALLAFLIEADIPADAEEVCRLLVDEDIEDLATLRLASRADLVEIGLTGPCSDAVLSSPHLHLH